MIYMIYARVSTYLWICAALLVIGLVTLNWGLVGIALLAIVYLLAYSFVERWVRETIAFDTGRVAQNLMLAAWDLGVGSVDSAVFDPALAQQVLGYPDGFRCDHIVSFGHPSENVPPTKRVRSLPASTHRDRWEEKDRTEDEFDGYQA